VPTLAGLKEPEWEVGEDLQDAIDEKGDYQKYELITVADTLDLERKKYSLSFTEMFSALSDARRVDKIASSAAGDMIAPIGAALGVYTVLKVVQKYLNIVKPNIKLVLNAIGAYTNPMELGEMAVPSC